jgi:hypothetical protein
MLLAVICLTIFLAHGKRIHELTEHHHKLPFATQEALQFLDAIQNPANCNGKYATTYIPSGGGFASQYQRMAASFMRALHATNYAVPVIITGPIKGYTENSLCDSVKKEWICLFKPTSTCHQQFPTSGTLVSYDEKALYTNHATVPEAFQSYGYAFWWGVIQFYLFNLQDHVVKYFEQELDILGMRGGLPSPLATLHVRHGDKHNDGFREHSLSSYRNVMSTSPDCSIKSSKGYCFVKIRDNSLTRGKNY